jgi:CHAD domain-containing protein
VKARKVPKLDPDGTFADAVRRIVEVRAGEVESFVPQALDPAEAKAQHDMRIAAKRLRYLLELAAPALGEPAVKGARTAKRLQASLGKIHDCDEMLERTRAHDDLQSLTAYLTGRRAVLFESFAREWKAAERGGFAASLVGRLSP